MCICICVIYICTRATHNVRRTYTHIGRMYAYVSICIFIYIYT